MADSVSSVRRSEIMSHIKSKDTSIELLVRRKLFSMGYRYRVNYKALPGKPDIVFTRKKIAIFIHGCYWHGHDCGSHYAHASQSNKAYWGPKIERTKQRDQEQIACVFEFEDGLHPLVAYLDESYFRCGQENFVGQAYLLCKIIRKVPKGQSIKLDETFDDIKKLPLNRSLRRNMPKNMDNPAELRDVIKGPALVVLPIAVYQ